MEQRTAGDGLVLRGEAELGRGRAPVSGEHLGSGPAERLQLGRRPARYTLFFANGMTGERARVLHPPATPPYPGLTVARPHRAWGSAGRSSARSSRLPRRCRLEGLLSSPSPRALGKPACVQTAGDVLLLFGFSVRRVDAWVLRLSERLHTLQI